MVYDTLGEYQTGVVCESLVTFWQVLKKVYNQPSFFIVYQPLNPVDDFGEVCSDIYTLGNICFLVEEIDSFLSLQTSNLDNSFLNIVQRGRHKMVELIGITQRPYSLPTILRSQCKEMYSFRQFERRDIEWLRGIFGERAEEIATLKQFEYLEFVDGNINIRTTKKAQ